MRKWLLIILLTFSVLLIAKERILSVGNIQICYPEKREQLATFTLNTIQAMLPQLINVFGASEQSIQIIIVDSQHAFEQNAGAHLPYWTAAVTVFPHRIIVLKAPNLTNASLRQYQTTVRHEFIHLYQSFHTPLYMTPTWYNEGLAVYLTDPYDIQSRIVLSHALFQDTLIPLNKLSDFLKYNHLQAELAYAESASLLEFLVIVFGESFIKNLTTDIKSTRDFNKSFYRLSNIEPGTLEFHWKKYISSRYRWIFLLDIHYIIWLIIPLLVIVVFFVKKHRNKRIIQQWNMEETEENTVLTK